MKVVTLGELGPGALVSSADLKRRFVVRAQHPAEDKTEVSCAETHWLYKLPDAARVLVSGTTMRILDP